MMHDRHLHPRRADGRRIHDHRCRCRSCKPASARRFTSVVPLHQPLPPQVRHAMDRIIMAVIGLTSVCALCLAWSHS